jgi:hypothetical protein
VSRSSSMLKMSVTRVVKGSTVDLDYVDMEEMAQCACVDCKMTLMLLTLESASGVYSIEERRIQWMGDTQ